MLNLKSNKGYKVFNVTEELFVECQKCDKVQCYKVMN